MAIRNPDSPFRPPPGRKLWLWLLRRAPWPILALTLLLFLKSLNYAPLQFLDDWHYVFQNENLNFSRQGIKNLIAQPVLGLWTPLPMATYLIDYGVGGLTPWVYRLQNILWHLAAVALVWYLLRELAVSRHAAFLTTLVFAIHPQRVESVVWIAERKDVVTAAFFFAALYFFARVRKRGRYFSIPALLCLLAAMYSKPLSAALPAVMFLLEVFRSRKWDFKALPRLWPYFLAALLYLIQIGRLVEAATGNISLKTEPAATVMLMLRNYFFFAGRTLLPLELNPIHPFFLLTAEAIVILGVLTAAVLMLLFFFARKEPAFFLYRLLPCLLIFGGLLLPVSGIQAFSNADFADRYSYIPSVFLLLPVFLLLFRQRRIKRSVLLGGLAVYVGYLALFNLNYQTLWQSDGALFQAACDTENPNFRAAATLAWQYFAAGLTEEALQTVSRAGGGTLNREHHQRQIENYQIFFAGLTAYRQGDRETAYRLLTEAERSPYSRNIDAISSEAIRELLLALAQLELERKNPAAAAGHYDRLAGFSAEIPFFRFYFSGVSAMIRSDYAGAVDCFEKAAAEMPDNPETLANLEAARKRLAEQQGGATGDDASSH